LIYLDVAILILVFNSTKDCITMVDLFEKHTLRHYFYLRDTYPSLVPHLQILYNHFNNRSDNSSIVSEGTSRSHAFLLGIFERVANVMSREDATNEIQSAILDHSVRYIIMRFTCFHSNQFSTTSNLCFLEIFND